MVELNELEHIFSIIKYAVTSSIAVGLVVWKILHSWFQAKIDASQAEMKALLQAVELDMVLLKHKSDTTETSLAKIDVQMTKLADGMEKIYHELITNLRRGE